jgi:carbohydrate-binding DOMON domain-containing protein
VGPTPIQAENLQQEEPKEPAPAATRKEAPISSNAASRSALLASTQVCLWVCVQAYTTYTHTHTCTHMHTYTRARTNTHTHMGARTHVGARTCTNF